MVDSNESVSGVLISARSNWDRTTRGGAGQLAPLFFGLPGPFVVTGSITNRLYVVVGAEHTPPEVCGKPEAPFE